MIFECDNYRAYLKRELVERIRKNPAYSLRAFSAQIGVSPSMLSAVLKGGKNLSNEKASIISSRLRMNSQEENYFLGLVQLENTGDVQQKEKILHRLNEFSTDRKRHDLSIDHFHSVADWICVAAMALLSGSPRGMTPAEVAARLSITRFEAEHAMNRWVNLDLLEVKEGRYSRLGDENLVVRSPAPNGALRKFHRTMLEKAIASLESQTNQEKFVGSETLAFDPDHLGEVSEAIEEAVRKILKIAKKSKNKKEVYHLGFQFFRVTKKGR
jgi:uncharacterized protein (TIGR02147 family)